MMPLRVGPHDPSRSRQWAVKLAMRFFMLREWQSSGQGKARLFSLKNQAYISRSWDWLRASSASPTARFRIRRRILHRPTGDRFVPFQCRCRPSRARSARFWSGNHVEKDSLCSDNGTRLCTECPRLYSTDFDRWAIAAMGKDAGELLDQRTRQIDTKRQ